MGMMFTLQLCRQYFNNKSVQLELVLQCNKYIGL